MLMSKQNKVNPGQYHVAGRLTPDEAARERVKQRNTPASAAGASPRRNDRKAPASARAATPRSQGRSRS
jgi:hypothetical protein